MTKKEFLEKEQKTCKDSNGVPTGTEFGGVLPTEPTQPNDTRYVYHIRQSNSNF